MGHATLTCPSRACSARRLTRDGKHAFVYFLVARRGRTWLGIEQWEVDHQRRQEIPYEHVDFGKMGIVVAPSSRVIPSHDGKTICVQGEEGPIGIDASSGKTKYALSHGFGLISLSPDGRTGAFISLPMIGPPPERTVVGFWDADDGFRWRQCSVPQAVEASCFPAFTADSRYFLVATQKGSIHVIDTKDGTIRSTHLAGAGIKGMFALSSGEIAAVGAEPKAIVIWKLKVR